MNRPDSNDSRDRLLFLLKTKGPLTAKDLAKRLAMTPVAARQHLQKLADQQLVDGCDERRGVGRPTRVWSLTEAGSQRFPDNHADLTVEILDAVRRTFGEAGTARLIAERTLSQLARYQDALPGPEEAPLNKRVVALAKLRTAEGYMAEVRPRTDGSILLIENHCPICAAARTCRGLCSEELTLFQQVLGQRVQIEREEHLLDGARRCVYRIRASRSCSADLQ